MSHVRDRWTVPGPNGRRVHGPRWGKGLRWQVRWVVDGYERSKTFPVKEAAEAYAAQMALAPSSPLRTVTTVGDWAERWQAEQLHYARSTAETVRKRLDVMVLRELAHRDLAEVTRADVQRLVVGWSQRWSASTVRQGHSFLATMFAAAVRDGLITASPCVGIRLPSLDRTRIVPLTVDQVAIIADRVAPRYRAMVIVGAATGLRGGELRGLTVDRIVGGDVVVDRQLAGVDRRRPVWEPPKSQAGYRRLALGQVAARALDEHGADWPPGVDGLVFTTRQHGPMDRKRAGEIWRAATEGMGLRARSGWHELRHHHASLLIAAGHSARAVADRLGHDDPAETLHTYTHLWPADHARMTAAVDAALGGLLGPSLDREGRP